MAIVVGDIHGHVEKTKAFLAYRPDQEHVALGDIVDSEIEPPSRQIECLRLLFEAGATLLWGNHDIQYAGLLAQPCLGQISGNPVPKIVRDHQHRFKAAHATDGYLLTHAGVCSQIAKGCTDPAVLAELLNHRLESHRELLESAWWMEGNNRFTHRLDPIFNVSFHRGGRDEFGGIFWFDTYLEPFLDRRLRQVYGHCETSTIPVLDEFGSLNLNYFDRNYCYIFDTESSNIVAIGIEPMDQRLLKKQYNREVMRKISGNYYMGPPLRLSLSGEAEGA